MNPVQINTTAFLTQLQWDQGIYGSVGEIGVHMGKYFALLALHSAEGEPLLAADLFQGVHTVDGSGFGDERAFLRNLRSVGVEGIHIIKGFSSELNISVLADAGMTQFRWFSVDAGHSLEMTLQDASLAACALAEGGIMAVDDIVNLDWPGVFQAASLLVQCQTRVAPFLLTGNKLFFTTMSHYQSYLEAVKASPAFPCRGRQHVSRHSFGRYEICWTRS